MSSHIDCLLTNNVLVLVMPGLISFSRIDNPAFKLVKSYIPKNGSAPIPTLIQNEDALKPSQVFSRSYIEILLLHDSGTNTETIMRQPPPK